MRHLAAILLGASLFGALSAQNQSPQEPLKLAQRIPLPGVQGRIDHMSVDTRGKRLFIAALGNETVEVVDLSAGKQIHTISGLSRRGAEMASSLSQAPPLLPLLPLAGDADPEKCRLWPVSREVVDSVDGVEST